MVLWSEGQEGTQLEFLRLACLIRVYSDWPEHFGKKGVGLYLHSYLLLSDISYLILSLFQYFLYQFVCSQETTTILSRDVYGRAKWSTLSFGHHVYSM